MDLIRGAMGVTGRKFLRHQYMLGEAVMDGDCTIDEAVATVEVHPQPPRGRAWTEGALPLTSGAGLTPSSPAGRRR